MFTAWGGRTVSEYWGNDFRCGKSGFTVNRGAVNRGFTVLEKPVTRQVATRRILSLHRSHSGSSGKNGNVSAQRAFDEDNSKLLQLSLRVRKTRKSIPY